MKAQKVKLWKRVLTGCMVLSSCLWLGAHDVNGQPLQIVPSKVTVRKLPVINFSTLKMSDLTTGAYKSLSPGEKISVLSKMDNRYLAKPKIPIGQKTGVAGNGLKYFISKGNLKLPSSSRGSAQTAAISNDLVVCKTTPIQLAKQFGGPLLIGLTVNPNQSIIYPGALFKDDDIVRGVFTPFSLPRAPGSITIDVLNLNGSVSQNVQDFNNRTQVVTAINALRSAAGAAPANTYLDYFESEFLSNAQINLAFEASMDVNLAPLIEIPATVASNNTGSITLQNSLNMAVAALDQVYYTISLGGAGPASTITGPVPANAVVVTDVLYGRKAFLTVGSYTSRLEASAVTSQLISVGLDESLDVASAERRLSAESKFALQSGLVKITVLGGSVAHAVTVNSLASLRNFVQQIEPSVAGVSAVPVAFTLRYAADNAPATVGAFASFSDRECFRADGLRVTLKTIRPTKVVDFGNEELYGTISVSNIGTLASGSRTLWNKSNPIQGVEGQAITVNESVTFNLNPAGNLPTSVGISLNVKDKIMGGLDPEAAGATDQAKRDGFVQYTPTSASVNLVDIRNAPNGRLTKTFAVTEGNARLEVTMLFELFNQ